MTWQPSLAAELAITMSDREVWVSIGVALLFGGLALLFGIWVARLVGLLRADAPAGETLGVGLASGLLVLAAWWAAIWSGGRSSFTPVAVGFAIALALAVARRARRPEAADDRTSATGDRGVDASAPRWAHRRSLFLAALAGGVFIAAIAVLYGATMAPSPRDGVQPIEFKDVAFYAILGRDLATTGTETILSPSGFSDIPGLPAQTWYHWGELWLASAVITVFGTAPLAARYFVVLPVLLLAAATLTGTLVRRMTGTASRGAFFFGFLACLFLTPVPLIPGPFFDVVLYGLIYGISTYGLAAVGVLLALNGIAVLGTRKPTWALVVFAGSAGALILPAHVVIALLALVGVGSVWAIRAAHSVLRTHRLPTVSPIWRVTIIVTVIALGATVAWGLLTGHGLGGDAVSPSVIPFDVSWRYSVAIAALGAGVFMAIPVAWFLDRRDAPLRADLYVGTIVLLIVGAIAWGDRLGNFNMFYVFYSGIAAIATPVAAIAARILWARLRSAGHTRLGVATLILGVIQLEAGFGIGIIRMQDHGPGDYAPAPLSLLQAIDQLPTEAKLAYRCGPFEEATFGTPNLLAIDAHTGRRIVPMCFEADVFSLAGGAEPSAQMPSADFTFAPQRALYPDAAAHPSSAAIATFLKGHGIDYIYADVEHPNSLVLDAVPIAKIGDAEILRLP